MRYYFSRANWRRQRWASVSADDGSWKVPVSAIVCVLFLISAWNAIGDFRFLLFGQPARATLVRKFVDSPATRYGKGTPVRVVEYRFDDNGRSRTEVDRVPLSWSIPDVGEIAIDYLPGAARGSRLSGHHSYGSIAFFLGCLTAGGMLIARVWRESGEPARTKEHRRKNPYASQLPQPWEKIG